MTGCVFVLCAALASNTAKYCVVGHNINPPAGEDAPGLSLVAVSPETGAISCVQRITSVTGTTYCAFSKDGKKLYSCIRERREGRMKGTLVEFPVLGGRCRLGEMRRIVDLPVDFPCHVSVSPDGRKLGFAVYSQAVGGVVDLESRELRLALLPSVGMGTHPDRQKKAYAHCAFFTPDSRRVGIIDLGCDAIRFYDTSDMKEDVDMNIRLDPGDGPRHGVWSHDNRFFYVLNELGNSVTVFSYAKNRFTRVSKHPTLPSAFKGFSKAAAIKFSPCGSMLLASNRGHDSIALFSVDRKNGKLSLIAISPLAGSFPRDFEFLPGGKYIIVGHKTSCDFMTYEIKPGGALRPVEESRIKAFGPLYFGFVP